VLVFFANRRKLKELFTNRMETLPTVLLKRGEADRVVAGHPWIYQAGILRLTAPAQDGDIVQVKDHRQRFLGIGFYNSKSKINVRWIAPERATIDQAFFEERIRNALALRKKYLPDASTFRVVNSESDLLSGLIVDKYEDVLVIQVSALGMDRRKDLIVSALQKLFSPRAIVERSDVASRKFEGLSEANGVLAGKLEGEMIVNLNGLRFHTSLLAGHKTGMYLDQQQNYKYFAEVVSRMPGAQVLDCFSFLGGFALHAARAGAAHVHAIDQSTEALALAERNAAENGLAEKCSFEAANVFDWLKAQTVTRPHEKLIPRFDVIVLDPPSFTRNRAAVPDALRGYKEIHLRALKLLKPGGTLFTYCCSHHINATLFQDAILSAAYDAQRLLRRVAAFSQSQDHPIVPSIPETEYLKGFAFEIIR
jgi:23S rRNA (cytosine1962-C5)-methyltransferase